jgi:hypothetical protein
VKAPTPAPAAPPEPPAPPPAPPLAPPRADGVRLLTNEQVAILLNIVPQSLRIKRMRGGGPPYVRLSGPSSKALYPEADLHQWLASRPRFVSTATEKAAAYASKKAVAPKRTRRRLSKRQVDFAGALTDSTTRRRPRPAARPSRKGKS